MKLKRHLTAATLFLLLAQPLVLPAFAAGPSLRVEPAERLLMDDIAITVSGAAPGAQVVIEASLSDESGRVWSSRGVYFADHRGSLDLAATASVDGSYTGVDPDGLFWSMLPVPADELAAALDTDPLAAGWPPFPDTRSHGALDARITANFGNAAATPAAAVTADHRILLVAPGVVRGEIDEAGLRGVYFQPPGDGPFPAVVVVTGSGGGANERGAAMLASHGFAALALAHFNYPGRPAELASIPLEYFRDAIDWIRDRAGAERVGLMGGSRGGEGVLLIAATFPERVSAVVSGVPSNVVWAGCCSAEASNQPAWTLGGKPVTAASYGFQEDRGFDDEPERTDWRALFLPGMANSGDDDPAAIRVERIRAPILMITGDADAIWPATIAAENVLARLRRHGFEYPAEHLMYTGGGHLVSTERLVTSLAGNLVHPVTKTVIALGGLPSVNARAMKDSFHRKIRFLKTHAAGASE